MHDFSALRMRLLALLPYASGALPAACAPQPVPPASASADAPAAQPEVLAAETLPKLLPDLVVDQAESVEDVAEVLEVAQPVLDCGPFASAKICYNTEQLKDMVHGGYNCKPFPPGADANPGTENCTIGPYTGPLPPQGCPNAADLTTCCAGNCCNDVCGPVVQGDTCCYSISEGCQCGRPYEISGDNRAARWLVEPTAPSSLADATTHRLAAAWRADAAAEYASVASFSRFALEMLHVGAPADLVADALAAAQDEIAHATACLAIATKLDGQSRGSGVVDSAGLTLRVTLAEVVAAAVREGCIGETVAAAHLAMAAAGAGDVELRAVLTKMADDEARHAGLAWRFVGWAVATGDAVVPAVVARALARAEAKYLAPDHRLGPAASVGDSTRLRACGRLPDHDARACARAAFVQVVEPCAAQLLGATAVC